MKKLAFALIASLLLLPGLIRTANADVSIDVFYDNLDGGSWFEVEGYGYCWQPDIAVNDPTWRPYADGYWAYTDVGWTWISYEDFGWATYHYGRWARLGGYGWVWVPGADLEWGPAWVSWRSGGDYIGWAPLPPSGPGIVYEGRPIGVTVDVDFDIGPEFYNFCDVRYIGEPVLRQRIVPVQQNITYINRTVNITNITVNNSVVYNYGPDVNVVNQHSSRPIQRLRLERTENVDVTTAVKSGGINKVQGNSLVVAAPMKISKAAKPEAPPKVKAKVESAKLERGWSGIDPNEQAKIKQRIKTEDRTKVPPFGAESTGQASATAAPAGTGTPGTPAGAGQAQGEKGKRPGREAQQNATAAPVTSPSTSAASAAPRRKWVKEPGLTPAPRETTPPANTPAVNERRGKGLERGQPGATPGQSNTPSENLRDREYHSVDRTTPLYENTPSGTLNRPTKNPNEREGGRNIKEGTSPAPMDESTQGRTVNRPTKSQSEREGTRRNIEVGAPGTPTQNVQEENASPPGGGKNRRLETSPAGQQGPQTNGPETPGGERRKPEGANAPGGGAGGSPAGDGKHEGHGKEKGSPSPPAQ